MSNISKDYIVQLGLPSLESKPRSTGLTIVIDNGYATGLVEDVLRSHADLVDYIKFGWGTALVTKDIQRKIAMCREHDVECFFGGTLFEKFVVNDQLDEFVQLCRRFGMTTLEVSNGTINITNTEKAGFIHQLKGEFSVLSEVGYKDTERSQNLPPSKWIEFIAEDFAAGAQMVITESRESGQSGICRSNGDLRIGLVEEIMNSSIEVERLIFEAPNKGLQTHFVQRLGSRVNLANIPLADIVPLETLRLGLRSDTFEMREESPVDVVPFTNVRRAG